MNFLAQTTQQAAESLIFSIAFWKPVGMMVFGAAVVDYHAYLRAGPDAMFDWKLFGKRMLGVFLTAVATTLGISAMS